MFIVQVSQDTELLKSVELYLEDSLEIASYLVVRLEENCTFIVQVSWMTDLLESVEVY